MKKVLKHETVTECVTCRWPQMFLVSQCTQSIDELHGCRNQVIIVGKECYDLEKSFDITVPFFERAMLVLSSHVGVCLSCKLT
jgi:hypothetical protein